MPMMSWLATHKPQFESWQVYVLIAVALCCVVALVIVICKAKKL